MNVCKKSLIKQVSKQASKWVRKKAILISPHKTGINAYKAEFDESTTLVKRHNQTMDKYISRYNTIQRHTAVVTVGEKAITAF